MDVCVAGRVGNDGVSYEESIDWIHHLWHPSRIGLSSHAISFFDTASPATVHYLGDVCSPFADVASSQALHTRHQARILDHISHKLGGVPANWVKFKAMLSYKMLKNVVRCYAYTMTMFLKFISNRNEGLNISSTTYNLDDDIQLDGSYCYLFILGWWSWWSFKTIR